MKKLMIVVLVIIVMLAGVILYKSGLKYTEKTDELKTSVSNTVETAKDEIEKIIENFDITASDKSDISFPTEAGDKIAQALEGLEELGFSTDQILAKAEEIYEKYGEQYVEHLEEEFTQMATEAAEASVKRFMESVKETIDQVIPF